VDREIGPSVVKRSTTFRQIYRMSLWDTSGEGIRAGPGSSVSATKNIRKELPLVLAELGVSSLFEAGCNECLWQPEFPGYIGADIVPEAIEQARLRHPSWSLIVGDVCVDDLPPTDAILCRDVLQHLSYDDGLAALANFLATDARWLIATTWGEDLGENRNITTGGWYPIRPELPPFDLGEPVQIIADTAIFPDGTHVPIGLGVWDLATRNDQ